MMNNVEETYIRAAMNGRMVELIDTEGKARIVEPYMVHITSTGERLLHCYQLGGFSKSHTNHPAGWRSPKVSDFTAARELYSSYKPRKGYNPYNRTLFPQIVFALPKPGVETPIPLAEPHPV